MDGGWQFPVVLSAMPEVWARLLEVHTVDATGRCSGCRSQIGPGARWPCVLYTAAARARRLARDPTTVPEP